jgi:hypothetical protein
MVSRLEHPVGKVIVTISAKSLPLLSQTNDQAPSRRLAIQQKVEPLTEAPENNRSFFTSERRDSGEQALPNCCDPGFELSAQT